MPSTQFGQLFLGVTTSPAREFIASAVLPRHERILLPCVGRWAVPTALVAQGVDPRRIVASDLSLFSSVIGYLADPRHTLDDLDVRIPDDLARFTAGAANQFQVAAGYLMASKYVTTPPRNAYMVEQRTELWANARPIRDKLAEGIEQQAALLAGLTYDVDDVRAVITDAAAGGDDTFLYVNLPGYKGGYNKLFGAAEDRLWTNRLAAEEFDPDEARAWLDKLTGRPATALAYVHHGDDQMPRDWHKLGAIDLGRGRVDYIVSNHDTPARLVKTAVPEPSPGRWPIYNEQTIHPDSKVELVRVDRDTGLHYRDLFVHRLGNTKAEHYALCLIDGRVTTAFGLMLRDVRIGKDAYVGEVFGISVSSHRYARLGKLFMLALTSGQTRDWLLHTFPSIQGSHFVGISTASPTLHHEGKADRGVMRLERRVERPGGGFQLLYRAEFRDDTWQDVMRKWHREQAWIARPSWDGERLPAPVSDKAAKKRKGRGGAGAAPPADAAATPAPAVTFTGDSA